MQGFYSTNKNGSGAADGRFAGGRRGLGGCEAISWPKTRLDDGRRLCLPRRSPFRKPLRSNGLALSVICHANLSRIFTHFWLDIGEKVGMNSRDGVLHCWKRRAERRGLHRGGIVAWEVFHSAHARTSCMAESLHLGLFMDVCCVVGKDGHDARPCNSLVTVSMEKGGT